MVTQQESAAWLAQNRPDLVSKPSTTPEQAAQANAQYQWSNSPAGVQYYQQQREQAAAQQAAQQAANDQDSYNEQMKHMRLFHPQQYYGAPDPSTLGNMSKAEIASRYGVEMAEATGDYFRANPSPEYQRITQQYRENRGGGSENPYDENSASGIAWLVNRQGGNVSSSLAQKAFGEGYEGKLNTVSGRDTTPVRDLSTANTLPLSIRGERVVAGFDDAGETIFMPYGNQRQIAVEGAKVVIDKTTGELGVYQYNQQYNRWGLTGGGGRASLQSGMFSIEEPLTEAVFTQESGGSRISRYGNESEAAKILASPSEYSRLGAEAYAGFVRPIDNRTIAPNEPFSVYGNANNLANLVSPQGANKGKAEAPGADIPWSIQKGSPDIQYMDKNGLTGEYLDWGSSGGRLRGEKTVASQAVITDNSLGGLPKPFVSKPETTRIVNPEGKVFGMYIPGISEGVAFFEPKTKISTIEQRTPMEPVTTFGTPYTEGNTTYYPQTTKSGDIIKKTETATPIAGSSGFDEFESGIRKMIPSVPAGEKAMEIASAVNPFSTGFAPIRAGKAVVFGAADTLGINTKEAKQADADVVSATDMYKGQYESAYEHPTLAAGSFAMGAAFGTVFKGAGVIGGAARSRIAPKVIARGQTARAVEMTGAGLWKTAQVGMVGLYAADLSSRATKGFTDLNPASVAPRARAMAVQEVYPVTVGFGMPDRVIKAAKISEIGYQQALLAGKGEPGVLLGKGAKPAFGISEPTTTGRFNWYIKQPVTRVASKPIDLVKQDYRAFLQEKAATTPQIQISKPGFVDYLYYKSDKPIAPESPTLNIAQKFKPTELGLQPVSTEYGAEIIRPAYGGQNNIGPAISKKLGFGRTPTPETPFLRTSESTVYQGGKWSKVIREPVGEVSPDLSVKAYGKQTAIFDSGAIKPESTKWNLVTGDVTPDIARVYPTMPVNLRVKAFMQEHPVTAIRDLKTMTFRPDLEIANINRASRVRLGDMFSGERKVVRPSLKGVWDIQPRAFTAKTPYPDTKTAETRTKSGQTLVSRTEMTQSNFPVSMQEPGFRGGIVYPRGPSPVQMTKSYLITEEDEYYTLPPGMVSPRQKQEQGPSVMSMQHLSQVPFQSSGLATMTQQKSSQITRQMQDSRIRLDVVQTSRQDQRIKPEFAMKETQRFDPARDIFGGQKSETHLISEPRFDIRQWSEPTQKTTTSQKTEEIVTEIVRTPPPPSPQPGPLEEPPRTPFGGWGAPWGGGGSSPAGNLGVTQWRRENLVADLPYLSRGVAARDFGFADDRQSLNPFAGVGAPSKKRRKKRRK